MVLESELIQSVQGKVVGLNFLEPDARVTKRQRRRGKTISKLVGSISIDTIERVAMLKRQLLDIQKGEDMHAAFNLTHTNIEFTRSHLLILQAVMSSQSETCRSIIVFAKSIVASPPVILTMKQLLMAHDSIFDENPEMKEWKQAYIINMQRNVFSKVYDDASTLILTGLELINTELNSLLVKFHKYAPVLHRPSHIGSM